MLDICEAIKEEIRTVLHQELVDIRRTLQQEVVKLVEDILQQRYEVIPGEVYQHMLQVQNPESDQGEADDTIPGSQDGSQSLDEMNVQNGE